MASSNESQTASHVASSPEKCKSVVETLANEREVIVQTTPNDSNIEACAEIKVENVLIKDEPSVTSNARTDNEVVHVVDSKSSLELPSLVCSIPTLSSHNDKDLNLSSECASLDREPVLNSSIGDLSLSFEMPDLTKSTDEDSNNESRTEEKQLSRSKKRTAGESTDKPEKKGKSEGKRKMKEELVIGKEAGEKTDHADEVSKVSDELKNDDQSTEAKAVQKHDCEQDKNSLVLEKKLGLEQHESSVCERELTDPKSSKVKNSKQLLDSNPVSEKRLKVATMGKGEDKKETRGKKKSKVDAGDFKLLDSNSQDSVASELELSDEKNRYPYNDSEDILTSAVVFESSHETNVEDVEPAANLAMHDSNKTVFEKMEDIIQYTDSTDLNVAATEWTGVAVEIDGRELLEEANRLDCFNVFEEAAKSMQGNRLQVDTIEETLSMLRSSCQQNVAAFADSPPDTSCDEFGPSASGGSASPQGPTGDVDEEHTSTKSELEAHMEVAAYMGAASNDGELSSDDDDDSGELLNQASMSPVNVQPRHGHVSKSGSVKRKLDENRDDSFSSGKRTKKEKQPHQHHHRTRSNHNRLMAIAKTGNNTNQGRYVKK